ncbi:MarR family winged helix-turn-helix transcriptional regulator [Nocardia amikacinitolerans]|uniref:MarR family winged helix-turn-helix transcriptional regulator n=1 Tax=Nocardia amikacinitolerans TaxID=756689 RepID=UPI0008311105|nr:MarR family transcriptional regulator [Nocardia amikacinitolerans]
MSTTGDHTHIGLNEHPTFLLAQLGVHTTEQFAARLGPLGIQPRHVAVLSTLLDRDGLSQQQLCESLHIHRNVMVGMVDDLERRGLVERKKHPVQRRAHALHVLPAGQQLLREAERILDTYEAELLDAFETEERRSLLDLLQRLGVRSGVRAASNPDRGACAAGDPAHD